MTVADVNPTAAKSGDLWWNSAEGQLYILYNDGNSMQWVVANNQAGNIGDAPSDGNTYGRSNVSWTPVVPMTAGNVGRNVLHNSQFAIQQRGAGPWTVGYTADRWSNNVNADTHSVSIIPQIDAGRTQIGDESCRYVANCAVTGNSAAGAYSALTQSIEGIRRIAGKTVIVSFYAAASAALKVGVNLLQGFGTGGSPSAAAWIGVGTAITVSTAWTRYTATFTVPTANGKTLGTNGDDNTSLWFWFSSGANQSANAGNIGVQSGTFYLWGVQLEIAQPGQTQPTALEKLDIGEQLRQCQRFYQTGRSKIWGYNGAGNAVGHFLSFATVMRINPTVALINPILTNGSGATVEATLMNGFSHYVTVQTQGAVVLDTGWTASADL
jgi:hypothetical protein